MVSVADSVKREVNVRVAFGVRFVVVHGRETLGRRELGVA